MEPLNSWIVRPRKSQAAKVRLVCIPYAGGGANLYRSWTTALPAEIEPCLVQLPGREIRFSEPLLSHSTPILNTLVATLRPLSDLPIAVFGHSMGALLAFELARRLESLPGFKLVQAFVSGRRAPHLPENERLHDLPEAAFIQALRRLGGTPEEVFARPELLRLILPILRADLSVDETHSFQPEPPLRCGLVALGGRRDPMVTQASVEAWSQFTKGTFRAAFCDGDHFFVQAQREFVLREVTAELRARLA